MPSNYENGYPSRIEDYKSPSTLAGEMDQAAKNEREFDKLLGEFESQQERDTYLTVLEKVNDQLQHDKYELLDANNVLRTVIDELVDELDGKAALVTVPKSKGYKHSRIRVQLSRPLTVSEAEELETDHHAVGARLNVKRRDDDGFLFSLRVNPNRTHVWVDADLPSRPLFNTLAAAFDAKFVNVHPVAVRTFTEYHA
jgi:hypothetical protein